MPRIPIITPESDLDAEQKRVLEGLLGRRGGRIPGPYRFTLHAPAVTEYMHPFGELLRLRSTFSLRLPTTASTSVSSASVQSPRAAARHGSKAFS